MQCYNHPENNVVATCGGCNKGLCLACTDKYTHPICDMCNMQRAKSSRQVIIRNTILTLIFAIVGFSAASNTKVPLSSHIIMAYIVAGIPWGWSALNRITANFFLFMPIGHWAAYFFIKSTLSIFVGVVAFPWKIFTTIKELNTIRGVKSIAGSK